MSAEFSLEKEWDDAFSAPRPPPEGKEEEAAPWLIPPLTNVYRANGPAYLWAQLLPGYRDLDLIKVEDDWIGQEPEWLQQDTDLEGIMGYRHDLYGDESEFSGGWANWGLEEGIGPGQPFCVEVFPPTWHRVSWEYDEWDCEYDWNIVRVMPRSPKASAVAWDRFFKSVRRGMDRKARVVERLRALRHRDLSKLYLRKSWYGRYSEGVSITLCSSLTSMPGWGNLFSPDLLEGRDDKGSELAAFEDLRKQIETSPLSGFVVSSWQSLRHPDRAFIKLKGLPWKNGHW